MRGPHTSSVYLASPARGGIISVVVLCTLIARSLARRVKRATNVQLLRLRRVAIVITQHRRRRLVTRGRYNELRPTRRISAIVRDLDGIL